MSRNYLNSALYSSLTKFNLIAFDLFYINCNFAPHRHTSICIIIIEDLKLHVECNKLWKVHIKEEHKILWLTALNFSVHFRLLNNNGGGIFIRAHFHSLCINNYAAVVCSSGSNCFVQRTFSHSLERVC